MGLVWQYGEVSRNKSWKGLSWGMVPLLRGAFCACMRHFFYNSESLEVLLALQAALTVLIRIAFREHVKLLLYLHWAIPNFRANFSHFTRWRFLY